MIQTVLLLFLIGHVLGDFYFQSDKLAFEKTASISKLVFHGAIYLLTMAIFLLPVLSWPLVKWILLAALLHFLIDLINIHIKKGFPGQPKSDALLYFTDQLLHILTVSFITLGMYLLEEPLGYLGGVQKLVEKTQIDVNASLSWLLAILIIVIPASISIKKALLVFGSDTLEPSAGTDNAGAFIGVLERCIILLLLFANQYAAIGFVLTAKSVARYNKIAEDKSFAERYLLGTLLSTLLVILTYVLLLK